MGIGPSFLPFLDRQHAFRGLKGPALGLGTLDLSGRIEEFGYPELVPTRGRRAVGALLKLRYAIDGYRDADINGLSDIHLDLNKPAPAALRNTFNLVLNAGTLEHVFDLWQAFENIHDMTRLGGTIVHIAPLTWMEHGYVNFSVKLFRELAASNGYATDHEAIWKRVPGHEGVLMFGPHFEDPDNRSERWVPTELFQQKSLPAYLLYFGAFTRLGGGPFTPPIEVGH